MYSFSYVLLYYRPSRSQCWSSRKLNLYSDDDNQMLASPRESEHNRIAISRRAGRVCISRLRRSRASGVSIKKTARKRDASGVYKLRFSGGRNDSHYSPDITRDGHNDRRNSRTKSSSRLGVNSHVCIIRRPHQAQNNRQCSSLAQNSTRQYRRDYVAPPISYLRR